MFHEESLSVQQTEIPTETYEIQNIWDHQLMEQQLRVPISKMGELAKTGDEPVKHADLMHTQGGWIGRISLLMPHFVLQFESNCHFSHLV